MNTALAVIFVFLMVIVLHEFGHFIVAKLVGIKVNEFSVGMGPRIFHKKKGETDYSIRALPIGGYVKMEGEDENSSDPRSFNNKPVGSRIAVVAAGAIMNFVLAIIVFAVVAYIVGRPTNVIDKTIENSPAYEAGLKSGDKIVAINDKAINSWDSISEGINSTEEGQEVKISILRNSQKSDYYLKPKVEDGRMIIGIYPAYEKSISYSAKSGFETTGSILKLMFKIPSMIYNKQLTSKDVSGPVGIIYTIGEAAKYGFANVLYIMGFISVNLGFFNLLPIPALDGSRILFLIIEFFRGKPINPEKEGFIHFVGFVALILLMIFVTYSDISRFNLLGR